MKSTDNLQFTTQEPSKRICQRCGRMTADKFMKARICNRCERKKISADVKKHYRLIETVKSLRQKLRDKEKTILRLKNENLELEKDLEILT